MQPCYGMCFITAISEMSSCSRRHLRDLSKSTKSQSVLLWLLTPPHLGEAVFRIGNAIKRHGEMNSPEKSYRKSIPKPGIWSGCIPALCLQPSIVPFPWFPFRGAGGSVPLGCSSAGNGTRSWWVSKKPSRVALLPTREFIQVSRWKHWASCAYVQLYSSADHHLKFSEENVVSCLGLEYAELMEGWN